MRIYDNWSNSCFWVVVDVFQPVTALLLYTRWNFSQVYPDINLQMSYVNLFFQRHVHMLFHIFLFVHYYIEETAAPVYAEVNKAKKINQTEKGQVDIKLNFTVFTVLFFSNLAKSVHDFNSKNYFLRNLRQILCFNVVHQKVVWNFIWFVIRCAL